jgi:pimeloyl-ACP methyl ester carboxylesterase
MSRDALYSVSHLAQGGMIRRFLYITVLLSAKLMAMAGRLAGEEPAPGKPTAVPMPTLGGKQFWADELLFHQWRIQRNALTDDYRLLDEHDLRHASGTFDECRAALERIKQERHLPRMSGKAVVVLHGLGRSRASMDSLCRYLRQNGYQVFNVGYPSTQEDMAGLARSLRRVIDNLDGVDEINFVAHSMGNIVVRHYLGDLARQEPWKQSANSAAADRRAEARFHRFVMLAPPNQGATLAEMFADNLLFREIAGDAGQQLGRDWPDLEKRLATPPFEFGIIAGGKGNEKGYNPLLTGDNDITVSVEATKLAGAHDFIVLPVAHSFIMDNAKVQQCVLRFLQDGHFVSEAERHPLEKTAYGEADKK